MKTNQELIELIEIDLGVSIRNRLPYAKEIFQVYDIDLLPHSSQDTLLGEVFEWTGKNYRSTNSNLAALLFKGDEDKIENLRKKLENVTKEPALVPDFKFTKEHIAELGFKIPSIADFDIKGDAKTLKNISITAVNVKKSRLTDMESPGIELLNALSKVASDKSKFYRSKIKKTDIAVSLFYADSYEIHFEKKVGTNVELSLDTTMVDIETKINNENEKLYSIKYIGGNMPFGANFQKGKSFLNF